MVFEADVITQVCTIESRWRLQLCLSGGGGRAVLLQIINAEHVTEWNETKSTSTTLYQFTGTVYCYPYKHGTTAG